MNATIFLVQGEHHTVPGNPMSAHATVELAANAARALVNIIRQDALYDPVTGDYSLILPQLEGEFDWHEALREWQRAKIADDYEPADIAGMDDDGLANATETDVWITELELELPAPAGGIETDHMSEARFAAFAEAREEHTAGCDDPARLHALDNARWPDDAPAAPSTVRVAVALSGGAFQWALADGHAVRVQIIDFDVEGHGDFDLTLVTDNDGDTAPANVFDAGPEIDPLYFARLDTAPTGVNGTGDCEDEDEEADSSERRPAQEAS